MLLYHVYPAEARDKPGESQGPNEKDAYDILAAADVLKKRMGHVQMRFSGKG